MLEGSTIYCQSHQVDRIPIRAGPLHCPMRRPRPPGDGDRDPAPPRAPSAAAPLADGPVRTRRHSGVFCPLVSAPWRLRSLGSVLGSTAPHGVPSEKMTRGRFCGSRRQCKEIENAHCDGGKLAMSIALRAPDTGAVPIGCCARNQQSVPHRHHHDARQRKRLHHRRSVCR